MPSSPRKLGRRAAASPGERYAFPYDPETLAELDRVAVGGSALMTGPSRTRATALASAVAVIVGCSGSDQEAEAPRQQTLSIDCSSRVEGKRPIPAPGPDDAIAGPIAFVGLRRAATAPPGELRPLPGEAFRQWKAGVTLRADASVAVSVASSSRKRLRLQYPVRGLPAGSALGVTFRACPRDEPAFSHRGVVGPRTGFSGGFLVAGPGCEHIVVRVEGEVRPMRRSVGFAARCARGTASTVH